MAKSVVRASMRTLSSQKPWTVAGRRAGASPEHVRPRTVSINARASFVPVCTRSSGGVFVGQLARPGRRRGRARRPRATPRSASADHRALNVRYWARLRWHVGRGRLQPAPCRSDSSCARRCPPPAAPYPAPPRDAGDSAAPSPAVPSPPSASCFFFRCIVSPGLPA